jgi:tetratricopeptide (TPR) repeat protein
MVSLCLIVRNEADRIAACLGSVSGLDLERIVVDTGSTDATPGLAESLGARVHHFRWDDDFSAARNASIELATRPWIFWLDADDRVDRANEAKLGALFSRLRDETAGYIMQCASYAAAGTLQSSHGHVRVFRRAPGVRWEHRVHEQIAPSIERAGGPLRSADIVIGHYGYANAESVRQKQLRNLRLSEMECEEHPTDPFVQFYRGWALAELGRPAEALVALNLSAGALLPGAHGRKLYALLARCYLRERSLKRAKEALATGRSIYPDDQELLFTEATVCAAGGDFAGAEHWMRRVLLARVETGLDCEDATIAGSRGRYFLALVCGLQEKYADAEAEAEASIAIEPGYEPTWLVLADALAGQGRLDQVEHRLGDGRTPPTAKALLRMWLRVSLKDLRGAAQELEGAESPTDPLVSRARQWLDDLMGGSKASPRIIDLLGRRGPRVAAR